jgi:hypothetical protein
MNSSLSFKKATGIDPNKDPISLLRESIHEHFAGQNRPEFIPTGVQEDYIVPFGCGDYDIILLLDNNKAGKTTTAVNILCNLFWGAEQTYFGGWWNEQNNYMAFNTGKNLYANWPYPKEGRIVGTVKNTSDAGPIRREIIKWWPKGRYLSEKAGKTYQSIYNTDQGFSFDVMTFEQDPEEFEGPLHGWNWTDEPPPAKIVGAITSRFIQGGIWLVTATPINCGPFLDIVKDLRDAGSRVYVTSHALSESSETTGKPNHLKTKRGLWSNEMIARYEANTPRDERDARIYGKGNAKSGKIYPDFDPHVHIIGSDKCPIQSISLESHLARTSNCFCIMDPHPKAYPAIQWWMLTSDNDFICYNEWPTREDLGAFYDECRESVICPYTPEMVSKFIKILDGTQYGIKITKRAMDPRFGKATEGTFGRSTESLMSEYAKYGLLFELPPTELIVVQRDRIRDLMRFDKQLPVNLYNRPKIFWMPHCMNSIRAIDRHYWDENTEKEADRYKDLVDTIRYMLALLGDAGYIKPSVPSAKRRDAILSVPEHAKGLHETSLA